MIEMEQRLLEDKSGDYRRDVVNQLDSYKVWLQQKMESGLSSAEFEALKKLKHALLQAEECIKTFNS